MRRMKLLYTALMAEASEDELYGICKQMRLDGVPSKKISHFLRIYIDTRLDSKDLYKLEILGVMQDLHGICADKYSLAEKTTHKVEATLHPY